MDFLVSKNAALETCTKGDFPTAFSTLGFNLALTNSGSIELGIRPILGVCFKVFHNCVRLSNKSNSSISMRFL